MWRRDDGSADEAGVIRSHRFLKASERIRKRLAVKQTGSKMVRPEKGGGVKVLRSRLEQRLSLFIMHLTCVTSPQTHRPAVVSLLYSRAASLSRSSACFTQELSPNSCSGSLLFTSQRLPDTGFRWKIRRTQRGWSAATCVRLDTLRNSNKNLFLLTMT